VTSPSDPSEHWPADEQHAHPATRGRLAYGEGFLSQETYRDVVDALRSSHRGFGRVGSAFAAIVQITGDKTLNTPAQMSVIRAIVREYQEYSR
jgi:hypothetical protein